MRHTPYLKDEPLLVRAVGFLAMLALMPFIFILIGAILLCEAASHRWRHGTWNASDWDCEKCRQEPTP